MKQKPENSQNYSVIILAAGKSSRMGMPKWSLQFDEKSSFIEHIISEYHTFGCNEIILVINETDYSSFIEKDYNLPENVKVVVNKHPEWDRFYSLKLGVNELEKVQSVFIHNVDNPFVNDIILSQLLEKSNEADIIVPEYNRRGGHPILISSLIIENVLITIYNIHNLKEFINRFKRVKIPVKDPDVLININNLEDYYLHIKFSV